MISDIFFIARRPCEVLRVSVRYKTAAGASCTLDVVKVPSGTAIGSGTSILVVQFDLNSTPDTIVTKETTALVNSSARQLMENDSLAAVVSGTQGSLAGLSIQAYCKPLGKGHYR